MTLKSPPYSLLLVGLLTVYSHLSFACPDGFHTFYCGTCPTTKCYNFLPVDSTFRQDFTESNSACAGQGTTYGGTGRLLEFHSSCEFERVKLLVEALQPPSPYLTGLRYDSQGNVFDSVAMGAALSGILSTSLPLTGATANADMCIAIGVTPTSSIDLMPVDCNAAAPSVCGLDTTALPMPSITGDDTRYVGPDGGVTLTCGYNASASLKGITWLRDGVDVRPILGDGNRIDDSPTSSTLTFTQFDRERHEGSYQCQLMGLLGDLVSKSVTVLPARAPAIQRPPANLEVYEFGLAFFDCFPSLDTVPHPTVQWSYNGAPLDVSNTTKYSVSPRTARLFISRVTQSDAGDYSCTLSNIERTVPSTGAGTLTVMATPGGIPPNPGYLAGPERDTSNIEVLAGTTLTVECVAETFTPNVEYSWTYPTGTSSQAAIVLDYPEMFGNLVLPDVQVSNSGEFEVQVRLPGFGDNNQPLNANSPRSVNVDVQAVPTVTSITGSQVVTLGTDVTLSCQFNGSPSPGVVWYQNGVVLRPSSKYVYSNTSSTSNTLTINNVQPADLTSYQCLPFNKRGSTVMETFLCGQPGRPGPVNAAVEPFTKDSVRITWNPPAEANDDIELLRYDVYYEIRTFGQSRTFDISGLTPTMTIQEWNDRSVLITAASQQNFIVAYVVAISANGRGAVAAEESYGITYGNTATVPPEDVDAVQADGQIVRVSWSAIPSDRQPHVPSDITYYEVEYYSVGGAVQEPTNIQTVNSTGLSIDITHRQNSQMVLAARVRGVTQLRREPDSFGFSPWSEVVFSGVAPPPPPSPLPIVLGVIIPVILLALIVFIIVILILYYYHRRQRGRYFPSKVEMSNVTLDRELNGTQGWSVEEKKGDDV